MDNPHVHQARGPVSEYPDRLKGGNGPAISGGLHPSKPLSRIPNAHSLADVLQATPEQLRDWQQTDPTLQKVRELASSSADGTPGGAEFFVG